MKKRLKPPAKAQNSRLDFHNQDILTVVFSVKSDLAAVFACCYRVNSQFSMATAMVGEGLEADTELGMMSVSLSEDSSSMNMSSEFNQPNQDEAEPLHQVKTITFISSCIESSGARLSN